MLFGRRKPGYTTTVDGSVDPEQAVLELQKAELAAKKKPKAEVFDIDAASETARRLKETGSTFDGSAAKTGEDVIAAVERETAELAAKQAAEAAPEAAEAAQPDAAKPELLDFLAGEPEAENDPFADQPTKTAPELPELTPAQELAGYIRARSAAALLTPHALLLEEVENADELLAQMPADPQCTDIVTRAGAKDTYYYSNANMSDNYAMIAQLIEDKDLCVMFAEMVRFNARIYPSATPLKYFQRSPYGLAPEVVEQTWKAMQENPEYADIEELTNNQNERFLFSTKHLTRRYAKAISEFDECLPKLINNLKSDDFLMITADHGCDPGYKGTDHTREFVPWLIYGNKIKSVNLGTIDGFTVVCNTVLSLFGINEQVDGQNVINDIIKR